MGWSPSPFVLANVFLQLQLINDQLRQAYGEAMNYELSNSSKEDQKLSELCSKSSFMQFKSSLKSSMQFKNVQFYLSKFSSNFGKSVRNLFVQKPLEN